MPLTIVAVNVVTTIFGNVSSVIDNFGPTVRPEKAQHIMDDAMDDVRPPKLEMEHGRIINRILLLWF